MATGGSNGAIVVSAFGSANGSAVDDVGMVSFAFPLPSPMAADMIEKRLEPEGGSPSEEPAVTAVVFGLGSGVRGLNIRPLRSSTILVGF